MQYYRSQRLVSADGTSILLLLVVGQHESCDLGTIRCTVGIAVRPFTTTSLNLLSRRSHSECERERYFRKFPRSSVSIVLSRRHNGNPF